METVEKKKETKVRTSITVSPDVLSAVKSFCESKSISVSSFIEEALQKRLDEMDPASESTELKAFSA